MGEMGSDRTTEYQAAGWLNSIDLSPASITTFIAVLAGAFAAWFLVLGLLAWRTRAGFIAPAPASQELWDEPPAIAHLLTNRWEIQEEAAEATFVDLAARGYLEITRMGPEPENAVVAIKDPYPADLTPYERLVFDRVQQVTVGSTTTPLPALAHGSPAAARLWLTGFRRSVTEHARVLGLSRSRVSITTRIGLTVLAFVGGVVTAATATNLFGHPGFGILGLAVAATQIWSISWLQGERDTEAGREAAARWLGMRQYLELHPSFAELPPAAVVMWGRYLAYAAALDVARQTLHVLELGPGDDKQAWSAYGGIWRKVRVRYPRRPSWGNTPLRAVAHALCWIAWGALMIFLAHDPLHIGALTGPFTFIGALATAWGTMYLSCAIVDAVAPLHIEGLVLRVRERKKLDWFATRYTPKKHRTYLALDPGSGETTKAWVLTPNLRYQAAEGEVVRIKVGRFFGAAREYEIVRRSWEWRSQPQAGGFDPERDFDPNAVALAQPTSLITPADVAAVLSTNDVRPTVAGTPFGMQVPGCRYHAGGAVPVMVTVYAAANQAGVPLLEPLRKRATPLSGLGDEAYSTTDSLVARKGAVFVYVQVSVAAGQAPTWALRELAGVAMGRLTNDLGEDPTRLGGSSHLYG